MPATSAGKMTRVVDPSEIQHFNAEERSGNRRAEDRREAGADAANHQSTPVLVAQAQDVREQARQGGANLRRRALLADGSAKRQRHHRRAELDGRHEPIHATGPLMHGGDDGLRAVAAGVGGERADDPDADRKRDRQKHERRNATVRERTRPVSRAVERPQKDARAQTHADASRRAEQRPFEGADQEGRMLGVPTTFVRETRRLVSRGEAAEPSQSFSKTEGHPLCQAYPNSPLSRRQ